MPRQADPKLWVAILRELEQLGGSARPEMIYPKLRRYFPELTDAEAARSYDVTGVHVWTNRIQFGRQQLVDRGLIDNSTFGIWRVSPDGRAWLQSVWRGVDADYADVPPPPIVRTPTHRPATDSRQQRPTSPKREQTRASPASAPAMQRLVSHALADSRPLSAQDRYLVAVVGYELGRYTDAARLLGDALAMGLDGEYRDKAERLRGICALKAEG